MNRQKKLDAIDRFESAANSFDDVVNSPREVLEYRPFPDAWTIHEQIVHTVESDLAGLHRYRRAIAEPGTAVLGYNEEVWTPALAYHTHDLGIAVDLFKAGRRFAAMHLRTLADADWSRYAYSHSQFGLVALEKWLADYIDHVKIHRDYVDRNLRLYAAR